MDNGIDGQQSTIETKSTTIAAGKSSVEDGNSEPEASLIYKSTAVTPANEDKPTESGAERLKETTGEAKPDDMCSDESGKTSECLKEVAPVTLTQKKDELDTNAIRLMDHQYQKVELSAKLLTKKDKSFANELSSHHTVSEKSIVIQSENESILDQYFLQNEEHHSTDQDNSLRSDHCTPSLEKIWTQESDSTLARKLKYRHTRPIELMSTSNVVTPIPSIGQPECEWIAIDQARIGSGHALHTIPEETEIYHVGMSTEHDWSANATAVEPPIIRVPSESEAHAPEMSAVAPTMIAFCAPAQTNEDYSSIASSPGVDVQTGCAKHHVDNELEGPVNIKSSSPIFCAQAQTKEEEYSSVERASAVTLQPDCSKPHHENVPEEPFRSHGDLCYTSALTPESDECESLQPLEQNSVTEAVAKPPDQCYQASIISSTNVSSQTTPIAPPYIDQSTMLEISINLESAGLRVPQVIESSVSVESKLINSSAAEPSPDIRSEIDTKIIAPIVIITSPSDDEDEPMSPASFASLDDSTIEPHPIETLGEGTQETKPISPEDKESMVTASDEMPRDFDCDSIPRSCPLSSYDSIQDPSQASTASISNFCPSKAIGVSDELILLQQRMNSVQVTPSEDSNQRAVTKASTPNNSESEMVIRVVNADYTANDNTSPDSFETPSDIDANMTCGDTNATTTKDVGPMSDPLSDSMSALPHMTCETGINTDVVQKVSQGISRQSDLDTDSSEASSEAVLRDDIVQKKIHPLNYDYQPTLSADAVNKPIKGTSLEASSACSTPLLGKMIQGRCLNSQSTYQSAQFPVANQSINQSSQSIISVIFLTIDSSIYHYQLPNQ